MTTFEELPVSARAELDAAVRAAYLGSDGKVRTASAAADEFETYLAHATQASAEYVHQLTDSWRRDGMKRFLSQRWSAVRVDFRSATGESERRPVNRSTRRRTDAGDQWVKEPLQFWTADDLRAGIADAVRRIEAERTTIHTYRLLLDLLSVFLVESR